MKITIDILFQRIAMKPTICKEETKKEREIGWRDDGKEKYSIYTGSMDGDIFYHEAAITVAWRERERERGPGEKSRVTSPESYNVWPPPVPTVATINLTIVKGRLIHATLLPDRYSPTPPNSPILSTFASNKLSPDSFFDHFFFFLLLLLLLFILFLFNFTF